MMNDEDLFGLEAMFASTNITIRDIEDGHKNDVDQLSKMDRLSTVCTFAALLATPALQANAYRLEALVHIAVARSFGMQHPTSAFVHRVFKRFGNGICGRLEDPAEDLFTTAVHCRDGNFVVFEGLREGNGFYLQRILDVIDQIPQQGRFIAMRRSVLALLTLSHAVASRVGLPAGILGRTTPQSDLPTDILKQLHEMRRWVKFDPRDLQELGLSVRDLAPFILPPDHIGLEDGPLIESALEHHPLLLLGEVLCLALPTSVGAAITRYVLQTVTSSGNLSVFETGLVVNYWEQLCWTPFAELGDPPPFRREGPTQLWIGSTLREIEPGRYVHLVVLAPPLDMHPDDDGSALYAASMEMSQLAMEDIRQSSELAKTRREFREGITLVVNCSLGRASFFVGEAPPTQWELEVVPIHDVLTMSSIDSFSPVDLFRMAQSKNAVAAAGIRLANANGLLNLWAWANDLKGHLIPHGELPEEFRGTQTPRLISVRQNGLLTLRQESYLRNHTRMAMLPEGQWSLVRRVSETLYEDEMEAPLYAEATGFRAGSFSTVYISDTCFWWISISADSTNRSELYEHWRMLSTWLIRFVPPVEAAVGKAIPEALRFHIHFESVIDLDPRSITIPSAIELENAFRIQTDSVSSKIEIRVGKAFDFALASSENIAERALLVAMLQGFNALVNSSFAPSTEAEVFSQICSSNLARSRHIMPAQTFRDMLHGMAGTPVHIHKMDDAVARIGIAFRVQSDVGAEIQGKQKCTTFLNEAVKLTQREICAQLQLFNRREFIGALLQCHEEAAVSRHHWLRTAHANIALHGDAAEQTISEHMAEMTACSISTRLLIEAANCECPNEGGFTPGDLDLSRVMARMIFAFNIGGWSDAIHWGAIAPKVRITPVGDIHVDHKFLDAVYTPFVSGGSKREVLEAVDSYGEAYSQLEPVKSVANIVEKRFLDAWEDEFGVPLDSLRKFADSLENLGIEREKLWFEVRRSYLLTLLSECAQLPAEDVAATVDRLTLPVRNHWNETPAGFKEKDWHPWRFRRRLSLLRRPLIAIESTEDPIIVVAPAIVREALYILFRSHHTGETPDWQVSSRLMLKWLGDTNNVTRTAFNSSVASQLESLGWKSVPDYKISRLLGIPLDRNYGDVDALAWDPQSGRVLAIECKHLHFHKTVGEVAEQLSDFRGELKQDGTRDLLRKHLDRIIVMESNVKIIRKRLGLKEEPRIEAYVVFKNPVPMEFSWPETTPTIKLLIASQLETLRLAPATPDDNG